MIEKIQGSTIILTMFYLPTLLLAFLLNYLVEPTLIVGVMLLGAYLMDMFWNKKSRSK